MGSPVAFITAETDDLEFSTQQMAIFVSDRLLVTRHNLYSRFLDLQHQRRDAAAGEDLPKRRRGRGHHLRVEGVGDGQRAHLVAGGAEGVDVDVAVAVDIEDDVDPLAFGLELSN